MDLEERVVTGFCITNAVRKCGKECTYTVFCLFLFLFLFFSKFCCQCGFCLNFSLLKIVRESLGLYCFTEQKEGYLGGDCECVFADVGG